MKLKLTIILLCLICLVSGYSNKEFRCDLCDKRVSLNGNFPTANVIRIYYIQRGTLNTNRSSCIKNDSYESGRVTDRRIISDLCLDCQQKLIKVIDKISSKKFETIISTNSSVIKYFERIDDDHIE